MHEKERVQHFYTDLKAFFRHSPEYETSDSERKVSRNIYPDADTCDRMRLTGPECPQLGPIYHCLFEESQEENELFLSAQDWVLSLDVNILQNT